jgi:hypothetical protein
MGTQHQPHRAIHEQPVGLVMDTIGVVCCGVFERLGDSFGGEVPDAEGVGVVVAVYDGGAVVPGHACGVY